MVVVASILYGFVRIMEHMTLEKVIPYTISAPNLPEDRRVLEKLSIKVRRSKPARFHKMRMLIITFYRLQAQRLSNATLQQPASSWDSSILSPPKESIDRSRKPKPRRKNGSEHPLHNADKSCDAYRLS